MDAPFRYGLDVSDDRQLYVLACPHSVDVAKRPCVRFRACSGAAPRRRVRGRMSARIDLAIAQPAILASPPLAAHVPVVERHATKFVAGSMVTGLARVEDHSMGYS